MTVKQKLVRFKELLKIIKQHKKTFEAMNCCYCSVCDKRCIDIAIAWKHAQAEPIIF